MIRFVYTKYEIYDSFSPKISVTYFPYSELCYFKYKFKDMIFVRKITLHCDTETLEKLRNFTDIVSLITFIKGCGKHRLCLKL